MIRLEQMCRHRKDKGYGISAKTTGIKPEQEELLGEVFNDSMNELFPKVGTSFLSCINEGGYLFYARNTLLTDAHGRISLYTHSYVLPEAEYVSILENDPSCLLQIPMAHLMDAPGGERLEPLKLDAQVSEHDLLQKLRDKYDLDQERYADLLYGAYHAIMNHWPLRLATSRPFAEREQMVREIAYCIMMGLLPKMRKQLSFSSGPDSRMCLSVIETGEQIAWLDAEDMVFGVEDDELTNIRITDIFRGAYFYAVAECSQKERHVLMEIVQDCISSELKQQNPGSVMLIATAYTRVYGDERPENKVYEFCGLKSCAGQDIDDQVADGLMTQILEELHQSGNVDLNMISHMADWYLRRSSVEYRTLANKILEEKATAALGVVLVSAALRTKETPNKAEIINVLMSKTPLDSKKWKDSDKKRLFYWIVNTDQVGLLKYVEELLPLFEGELTQMLEHMLRDATGKELSKTQIGIQCKTMEWVLEEGLSLSEVVCGYLDSHVGEFNEQTDPDGIACSQIASYLIEKRLDQTAPMVMQARFLLDHARRTAYYERCLERELRDRQEVAIAKFEDQELKKNRQNLKEVLNQELARGDRAWTKPCLRWEYYQAEKYLVPGTRDADIPKICRENNGFRYNGYFEQRVTKILADDAREKLNDALSEINSYADSTNRMLPSNLKKCFEILQKWVTEYSKGVESMVKHKHLSKNAGERLMKMFINDYWEHLDFQIIFRFPLEGNSIQRMTDSYGSDRSKKMYFLHNAVGAYKVKAKNKGEAPTRDLVNAVLSMWSLDENTIEPIKEELERMLRYAAIERKNLPLDIILLCSLDPNKMKGREPVLNGRKMHQLLDRLQNKIDSSNREGAAPIVSMRYASYIKGQEDKNRIINALKLTLAQRSKLEERLIRDLEQKRKEQMLF